jgi:hypothetical protein
VEAYDEQGRTIVDRAGELVLTRPMPSMPVGFCNDPGERRYRESYFAMFPGVWRHGDWIRVTSRGSCIIYGRSDSTLNRGGVRMGTSEFYRAVEVIPEVVDSLVIDTGEFGAEGKLLMFIVPAPGVSLDQALKARITDALRRELSPRHVPDEIHAIGEIPYTLNGKKVEVPVKRILMGTPLEVADRRGSAPSKLSSDLMLPWRPFVEGTDESPVQKPGLRPGLLHLARGQSDLPESRHCLGRKFPAPVESHQHLLAGSHCLSPFICQIRNCTLRWCLILPARRSWRRERYIRPMYRRNTAGASPFSSRRCSTISSWAPFARAASAPLTVR